MKERKINKKVIDIIVGARPNFMKVSALFAVADQFPSLKLQLVHTGQHYDEAMSDVFFKELGLPKPVCNLSVGSSSHATQTAQIMIGYELWVNENRPDVCLVVGDVNSTVACALVAAKIQIPIAHVEAGLRSFDRTMPEEINRIVTDRLSRFLFVNEPSGIANLENEGVQENIHLVGNVMIDTLLRQLSLAKRKRRYIQFDVIKGKYAFVTLHRPSNVDDSKVLQEIVSEIFWLSEKIPVVFAVHPRTKKQLQNIGKWEPLQKALLIHLTEPLPYLDSLSLIYDSQVVVTDSGGLQEETTALNIPCLTLRHNTERPITVDCGTNTLIKGDWQLFKECVLAIEKGVYKLRSNDIQFWDGQSGFRILEILENKLSVKNA